MPMPLTDPTLRDGVDSIKVALQVLYQGAFARFGRGLATLEGEALTEFLVELCDVFDLNRELCQEIADRKRAEGSLSDARLRREMGELTEDLVTLYEVKYPRFYNAIIVLEEAALIEMMVEMCQIFASRQEIVSAVAKQYKEHRLYYGSFEDRDWPEN